MQTAELVWQILEQDRGDASAHIYSKPAVYMSVSMSINWAPISVAKDITYAGKKFATTGHSCLEVGFIFDSHSCDELVSGKSSTSPGARFDSSIILTPATKPTGIGEVKIGIKGTETIERKRSPWLRED